MPSEIETLQYLLLFALSLLFSLVSLNRQTLITYLLSSVFWFATALTNFVLTTGALQVVLSYVFAGLGLIYMLASIAVIADAIYTKRNERFNVGL